MNKDAKIALGIVAGLFLLPAIPASIMGHADKYVAAMGSLIFAVVMMGLYLVPSIVAAVRKTRYTNGIVLTNIFLGWTFVGWVGALVWAVSAPTDKPQPIRSYDTWKAESRGPSL